jgi:hypothetical protein
MNCLCAPIVAGMTGECTSVCFLQNGGAFSVLMREWKDGENLKWFYSMPRVLSSPPFEKGHR